MAAAGPERDRRTAVCPGSFDPLTNGHVDIVRRAAGLFDRVLVAILVNDQKIPFLPAEDRARLARSVFADEPRIAVDTFDGLLVDFAARTGAAVVVRGLRGVTDFEYERQMALMNRQLAPGVETVFLVPSAQYSYVSSRLVREIVGLGGSVTGLVPAVVEARLQERRAARERAGENQR